MLKRIATAALMTAVTLTSSIAGDKINGVGASFPAPLYYDWAYNYQSIGSGGGIKQISNRIVNFGASDKPLKTKELTKKKLLQFPAVIGSIVIAHHVTGVADEVLKLKNSVVADIFAGKITKWNDAAIKADNADLALPDEKIIVVHRSDGSGTTYNFTYYLSGSSENWKNNLAAATLQTASGKWVTAREDHFKAAAKYASWTKEDNFYAMLALQPGATSYPIVAATFILLPIEKVAMNKKVNTFYDFAFKNGDAAAKKLGYIPLPQETKKLIREYWATKVK